MVFMLFLASAWGCQKEDYTLPASLSLNMSISKKPVMGGSLVIDEIKIRLNSVDIQGYRETGGDVFMTRPYKNGKSFRIISGAGNESIKFDVPQGVYKPLSFSFVFQHDDDEDDLLEDIEEWYQDVMEGHDDPEELEEELGSIIDDYIEDIEPSILILGRYRRHHMNARLILLVNDPMTFRILTKSADGSLEIILDKEKVNSGNLIFDPSYWFSVINPELMDHAFLGRDHGITYIFLSKYVNSRIYYEVFNRIEESTSVIMN